LRDGSGLPAPENREFRDAGLNTPRATDQGGATLRRIGVMLDELSLFVSAASGVNDQPAAATDEDRDHRSEVLRIMKSREARGKHFPADWFSNPAWDLLLFLYEARLSGTNVTVGDVGNGTGTRPTTTIRWLEILESEALLDRRRDTIDTRRVYITLNDKGAAAMRAYFNSVPGPR